MEKKVYCFKSTHNFYKECEEVVKSNAKSVVQGQVYANQFKVEEWAIDRNYFLISKEDYDKLNRKDKKLFTTEKDSNWCKLKNSEIINCVPANSFNLICINEGRYIIDDNLYIVTLGEVFDEKIGEHTIITFEELNEIAKKSIGGILNC